MKIAAIIAEYNPFHLGHSYQLSQIDADFKIILMSGNYVQRGEPAIVDKWTRTQIALHGGADLVLELPTTFSAASAEFFAQAGIFLLEQCRIVTHLYFGAEHPHLNELQELAWILNQESPDYSEKIKYYQKKGHNFAKARQSALMDCFPKKETALILKGSNNILAIEYLKALQKYESKIEPVLIPRKGQAYLESNYQPGLLLSATAIRKLLLKKDDSRLKEALPEFSYLLLKQAFDEKKGPVIPADLFSILKYNLLSQSEAELLYVRELKEDLFYRIRNASLKAQDYSELLALSASRNFPLAKIKRALLNIFLQQKIIHRPKNDNMYLKILGFRSSALPLLNKLKDSAALPLISNHRQSVKLKDAALDLYQENLKYDKLYHYLVSQKYGKLLPSPEQQNPVILPL